VDRIAHAPSWRIALLAACAGLVWSYAPSAFSAAPAPPAATTPAAQPAESGSTTQAAGESAATRPIRPADVTDEMVVAAMKKGIDYLISARQNNLWEIGPWDGRPWLANGQVGGESALVVYALLHAGQSLQDDPVYGPKLSFRGPDLAPAIAYLCRLTPQETYTASLQANALALLPQKKGDPSSANVHAALQRTFRYLAASMMPQGGYTYGNPGIAGYNTRDRAADLSNTQYGALGMWALEEAGIPAPSGYWQVTDVFWRRSQQPSGAWKYWADDHFPEVDRDSMGVAGIATLYIAQEYTDRALRTVPKPDNALDMGLAWLSTTFKPDSGDLYYMYGVERVGMASGLKFLGTTDWYRACAADIIAHQQEDGCWDSRSWTPGFRGTTPTTATAFALLFLARGRNPVLFNKLQYDGYWNARPRDAAFLTRFLGKRLERPLNWQVVNLQVAPEQWADAPILMITGSRDPKFTPEDVDKLRTFVESGGMILSNSDESSKEFTEAMRKYAGQVSHGRYEMRTLLKTHVIFNSDLNADLAQTPQVMGMSNGIRELWVHMPFDVAAAWQTQRTTAKPLFELPTALYFYATGKVPLKPKLKALDFPEPSSPPSRTLALARVRYAGNWNPEPQAWSRLAKMLHSRGPDGIELKVSEAPMAELDPKATPVAEMTGTARFLIKDTDIAALKAYLDGGGLLIVDAGGGSKDFTETFGEMVQRIYPGAKLEPLPPGHPIFTGAFADQGGKGPDLSTVDFRKYGIIALGKRITQPDLQSVSVDGKVKILLSRYDLTSGLVGSNAWGIVGYTPESSANIAENLLRFGIQETR
jgi:hypothetical protein